MTQATIVLTVNQRLSLNLKQKLEHTFATQQRRKVVRQITKVNNQKRIEGKFLAGPLLWGYQYDKANETDFYIKIFVF